MKTLLIVGIIVGAVLIGVVTLDLASRSKQSTAQQAPPQPAVWSTTIVLEAPKAISAGPAYPAWQQAADVFASAFAFDRSCKGLTLMLSDREGFRIPNGRFWSLHIDPFIAGPAVKAQVWSIKHDHESGDLEPGLIGYGTSTESAVNQVCAIVKQEGGTVR